jgi:hypothetical protein
MSSQKRTIIGSCDYSIITLQGIKKDLHDLIGEKDSEIAWAIGGIVVTLVRALIEICDEVLIPSVQAGNQDSNVDLREILRKFNEFMERNINHG